MSDNNNQNNNLLATLIQQYFSNLKPAHATIYATLVTLGLIVLGIQKPINPTACEVQISQNQQQQYNTRADYERLEIGDDIVKVESILGRGIEMERSHSQTTMIWQNPDCSKITAIFQDDKLQSKSQTNLN